MPIQPVPLLTTANVELLSHQLKAFRLGNREKRKEIVKEVATEICNNCEDSALERKYRKVKSLAKPTCGN